jgi:hypothetical protein
MNGSFRADAFAALSSLKMLGNAMGLPLPGLPLLVDRPLVDARTRHDHAATAPALPKLQRPSAESPE